MTWRYFDAPEKYVFLLFVHSSGSICACVTGRFLVDSGGLYFLIADCLFLPSFEDDFLKLLNLTLFKAVRNGANGCLVWCSETDPSMKLLLKCGFSVVGDVPVVCFQNKASAEVVSI